MKYQYFFWQLIWLFACNEGPSPPKSPMEELSTFELAQGFEIELVAADPLVQDPIVARFDEDGRLWVVEMRGFMPDIDGTGENSPVGRVSILFDEDSDGQMDSAAIYVDSLVLPRALAIVKGGALVAEDAVLWFIQDTNGDLKADRKTIIDENYGNPGVVEHSANGLWRGMDNWIYNAKSKYRYRQIDDEWIKEETEFRGQWGICHDNYGQLFYNYNWSQLHADLVPPNYFSRNLHHKPTTGIDHILSNDRRVFPIRSNLAINRGYVQGTLDSEGKIIEFASACAPFVYRGDAMGTDVVGNVFVCEPTGNLVKRNLLSRDDLNPTAVNAYDDREFLASSDERFRPVGLASGPDGGLYIIDMYRGIVQHGPYMSPYLREITLQRKLDQPINLGRIWRVQATNSEYMPPERLSRQSTAVLVEYLEHDNGWYRDMAQRILVERDDKDALVMLKEIILNSKHPLARLHALWTLEGLGNDDTTIYLQALEDSDQWVKTAALRLLEMAAIGDSVAMDQLEQSLTEPALNLPDLQVVLSAGIVGDPTRKKVLMQIFLKHSDSQLFRDAAISSLQSHEYDFLSDLLDQPEWQEYSEYKQVMIEQLVSAAVSAKNPQEMTGLLQYIDHNSLDWQGLAVLNGLSFHSHSTGEPNVELQYAPEIFQRTISDESLRSKISRAAALFNWPGKTVIASQDPNKVSYDVSPEEISQGRNLYLTICANCHGNDGQGIHRFAPPLVNSEWVLGSPDQLTKILLHGMEGPVTVNEKLYDIPDVLPAMPAFATNPPENLAAIMTYIRQEWGHDASPVKPGAVGRIRVLNQGKIQPWTAEELSYSDSAKINSTR